MRRLIASVVVSSLCGGLVHAQGPSSCPLALRDACQKADDVYSYMFPQLGTALAGGHPTLGSSKILGGLGHFSVGVRATGVFGSLPDLDDVSIGSGSPVAQNIPTSTAVIPGPAIDAAIGLYSGFPLGVTRIGGIDALVSIAYLPSISSGETDFDIPDGNTRFGFGARLGLLEESIVVPGVSLAYLQRPLPTVSWLTQSAEGVQYGVENLEVDVGTWRLVATKSFLLFDLSGGFGGDSYKSSGALIATDGGASQRVSVDRDITRTTWFVGLTIGAGPIHIGAEFGGVGSGSIGTFNAFDPKADASRTYASVGVRVGM
jgi:hypothetical protein